MLTGAAGGGGCSLWEDGAPPLCVALALGDSSDKGNDGLLEDLMQHLEEALQLRIFVSLTREGSVQMHEIACLRGCALRDHEIAQNYYFAFNSVKPNVCCFRSPSTSSLRFIRRPG